ncbi:transporter [Capnocytophaga canimorsus]|uniref:transporter n=1 Tax=Capnocytophaga canimorsus TaxID=28188 RepID=UPI0037CDB0F9
MKIIRVIILLLCSKTLAQSIEDISTDRPDQSEGVYTLTPNVFQLENGLTFREKSVTDNLMLRYGVIDGTEIRIETNFGNHSGKSRFDDFVFSAKQKLTEVKGWIPAITLVGYLAYAPHFSQGVDVDAVLAFERDLTQRLYLVYNIGSANKFKNVISTLQLGTPLLPQLAIYAEYFGTYAPENRPEHGIDVGLLYVIRSNFQIDASLGRDIFSSESNFYAVIGASYRFTK